MHCLAIQNPDSRVIRAPVLLRVTRAFMCTAEFTMPYAFAMAMPVVAHGPLISIVFVLNVVVIARCLTAKVEIIGSQLLVRNAYYSARIERDSAAGFGRRSVLGAGPVTRLRRERSPLPWRFTGYALEAAAGGRRSGHIAQRAVADWLIDRS